MREKFKKRSVSVVVFSLLICMIVTSVNAYYTDHHSIVNVFTTGKVKIELNEPKYDRPENVKTRESLAPGELVIKDPAITNTGKSDCFVFAVFHIPRSNRTFIDSNGKKMPVEFRNLFEFEENNGWSYCTGSINDDVSKPYESFIYAYSDGNVMTALKPGEKTSTLFKNDTLKFANVMEIDEKVKYEIPVTVYAIQSTDLIDSEGGQISTTSAYRALFMQLFFEEL